MVQIIKLLGNKNFIKIISFFFKNPMEEFSQTNLITKVKLSKVTLIKQLKELVDAGILLIKRVGNVNLYRLNAENLFAKRLKVLFILSELEQLKELSNKYNVEIYLYGSCARGEDTKESDIDIMVIGTIDKPLFLNEIKNLSEKIGKEIKAQIFSKQEWSLMARKDPAFYERVEKDKVKL